MKYWIVEVAYNVNINFGLKHDACAMEVYDNDVHFTYAHHYNTVSV